MTPAESELLSCYHDVTKLGSGHQITLVQHDISGKIFVKKILNHYNLPVYRYMIDHPVQGTPRIYAAIEEDDHLITIEDYLAGTSLQEMLDAQGKLPEEQVMDIMLQLCAIVSELHHAAPPIVHRDIKPENILIASDGNVYLLDMNAARQFEEEKREDTKLLGTAGFAAPEQYGFAQSDTRTDIYALGVLINVLLTGEFPKDLLASGQLRPIIQKCTQLEPARRYASAEDLLRALKHPKREHFSPEVPSVGPFWKRFLPPGFRSGKPWFMILAVLIYLMLISLGVTFKIDDPLSARDLRIYRIFVTIMLLAMALFTGNYLNIQDRIPLANSRNLALRIIAIIVINCFIFVMTVLLLSIFIG